MYAMDGGISSEEILLLRPSNASVITACSDQLLQPELKTHTTTFISCISLMTQYKYLLARILEYCR